MAVNLKTNCGNCVHQKMCKYVGNAKHYKDRLCSMNYGDGPNDDYDFGTMSEVHHVQIDISCPDFEEVKPVPRKAFR